MAFTRGSWKGTYVQEGSRRVYQIGATFNNNDASDFNGYWTTLLTKTTTANCTITLTPVGDNANTKIVIQDTNGVSNVHEPVIADIDTVEDALVAADTSIGTANTDAATYASTRLTYTTGTP